MSPKGIGVRVSRYVPIGSFVPADCAPNVSAQKVARRRRDRGLYQAGCSDHKELT